MTVNHSRTPATRPLPGSRYVLPNGWVLGNHDCKNTCVRLPRKKFGRLPLSTTWKFASGQRRATCFALSTSNLRRIFTQFPCCSCTPQRRLAGAIGDQALSPYFYRAYDDGRQSVLSADSKASGASIARELFRPGRFLMTPSHSGMGLQGRWRYSEK